MTDPTMKPLPLKGGRPVEARPSPAMTVQFHLKHGAVILWPVPGGQEFSFSALIGSIRSTGCFMSTDVYIPADEIACIGLAQGNVAPSAKIQQPMHPTRQ